MSEGLFDIKNDRRLSMYLYRMGFGMWLMYLILGAPAMSAYVQYRMDCGVLCFILMIIGFSAAMVFDFVHNKEAYEQKKKWLFVSYIILAGIIYFFVFDGKQNIINFNWLLRFV